jgi:ADP-dependent NAD(P)H-hydrate dehydratase / NAD(P)H-hydrate epimerase
MAALGMGACRQYNGLMISSDEQSLPEALYTAAQVRELDRIAIEEFGIAGYELMTRAGQAVFDLLLKRYPAASQVTVFCGSGNNAGDGFVTARLALAAGKSVKVFCLAEPESLKGAALQAYLDFAKAGGEFRLFDNNQEISADVIIDALFGTGLTRVAAGLYGQAIAAMNGAKASKIAVDIPSGLHADTGNALGCAVQADCTVTFIGLKQGLFTGQAADYCGDIVFTSLGVPDEVYKRVHSGCKKITRKPLPKRERCSHKGSYGHVLIVGGDSGYSGAARLAGEAAARVGAGLISIATRKQHSALLNGNRPELMCHGVENAEELSGLIDKASVIALGPGLGQSLWAESLFNEVINSGKPLVVDADGLNLLAKAPGKNTDWVLTPHPGEAARLLNTTMAQIQADRFAAVRALQARYGGVGILKGAGSLVASDESISVATTGNPGMASGGMGDVLTGVIAGLIAQGLALSEAAQQGVYLHGLAADLAAGQEGERGLLASDLLTFIRKLVN